MCRHLHLRRNCNDWKAERTGSARSHSSAICSSNTLLHPQRTTGFEKNATVPKISTGRICENSHKIKGKALNTRVFKALCEEMGSEHTKLQKFHTEVRWL